METSKRIDMDLQTLGQTEKNGTKDVDRYLEEKQSKEFLEEYTNKETDKPTE